MNRDDHPILEVRDVSVVFGTQRALDSVSLSVPPNIVYGLIGPNGAGKSTMIDTITGYLPSAVGEVYFREQLISTMKPYQRAQAGISRTFQTLELFEDLTVTENLLVAAERRGWWGRFADLVRPTRHRQHAELIDRILGLLEIEDLRNRLPVELSHGHRNLVSVARALAASPQMILLDEPAAGLDHDESEALGRRLRRLLDDGVTVFLVDHDMDLVLSICDQIQVLDFGRTIAVGTPAQVRENAAVIDAYLGVPAEAAGAA